MAHCCPNRGGTRPRASSGLRWARPSSEPRSILDAARRVELYSRDTETRSIAHPAAVGPRKWPEIEARGIIRWGKGIQSVWKALSDVQRRLLSIYNRRNDEREPMTPPNCGTGRHRPRQA